MLFDKTMLEKFSPLNTLTWEQRHPESLNYVLPADILLTRRADDEPLTETRNHSYQQNLTLSNMPIVNTPLGFTLFFR